MEFTLTRAPLFMSLVTLYFMLLPFLVYGAIKLARKGKIIKHYKMQIGIFIISVFIVFIFEAGVRISGGFFEYIKLTTIPYNFLSKFLLIHIIIAVITLFGWIYLIIKSYISLKRNRQFFDRRHKTIGVLVFSGICVSSLMGFATYVFLFMF